MSDVKRNYVIDSQIEVGKVCQVLNTNKIQKLPKISSEIIKPNNSFTQSTLVNLDSATMNTTSIAYKRADGDKILCVWSASNSTFKAKLLTEVDGSVIPGSVVTLFQEVNGGGYYYNDLRLEKINENRFLLLMMKPNYSSTSPFVTTVQAMIIEVKNGQIIPMCANQLMQISINSGGSLSSLEAIVLNDSVAVLYAQCWEGNNYVRYQMYWRINLFDEPYYSSNLKIINSEQYQDTGSTVYNHLFRIDDTTLGVLHKGYNSVNHTIKMLRVNDSGIVEISTQTLLNVSNQYMNNVRIFKTKNPGSFVVVYQDSNVIKSKGFTINAAGTLIPDTTQIIMDYGATNLSYYCPIMLGPSKIIIVTMLNDYIMRLIIANVSDIGSAAFVSSTALTNGTPKYQYPQIVEMSSLKAFVEYVNADSSPQYSCGSFLNFGVGTPAETRDGRALGVALNEQGDVLIKGNYKTSGLMQGANYYYDTNGVISTTATGTFLGVALSDSELLIPDYLIS